MTQRAIAKPTFGGVWTNSCCGHPAPGEPIADAVLRRTRQELGLDLEGLTLCSRRSATARWVDQGGVENVCPVFVARTSGDPHPDPTEVEAWEWVPWPEFRADVLPTRGQRLVPRAGEALPEDPLSAPAADPSALPPAARPAA